MDTCELVGSSHSGGARPHCLRATMPRQRDDDDSVHQLRANVFDGKRLIDRKRADTIVQSDLKLWPFEAAFWCQKHADDPGAASSREENKFHPEAVSSMVLTKMKETSF